MPGTRVGGLKTAEVNKKKDPDFYHKIGKLGGAKSRGGGFAYDRELAREAGRKGGKASKRKAVQRGRNVIEQVALEAKHQNKLHKTWKDRLGL